MFRINGWFLRWVANFNQDKKKISILISSKTIKDLNLVSLGRGEKRIISSAFHPE
jgi:hypothetical protein